MKQSLSMLIGMLLLSTAIQAANILHNVYVRKTTSLNGEWQTIVDPYDAGYYDYRMNESADGYFKDRQPQSPADHVEYTFSDKETLRVPGDWNTQRPQLFFYEGSVWYKKEFEYNLKKERILYLYFAASNYQTEVYLNGEKLGMHIGGFTPFFFDITDKVKRGKNTVIVRVNNVRKPEGVPTMNSDWWNYGGLTRDVMLVETPMCYVDDYEIRMPKESYDQVLLRVKLNLPVAGVKVEVKIPNLKLSEKLVTDNTGFAEAIINKTPDLWSPEHPHLYDVEIKCEGEKITDQIGFRHIEARGRQLFLNGKPFFLKGVSVHEEAPYRTGRCTTEQDDSTLISWARFIGCNFLRLAHYPHNEQMVRMAERMGLLLWSGIPVYWTIDWSNADTYANAARQLNESIDRDHNRCSIIIWSIANETPRSEARDRFLTALVNQVRLRDDERLVSMAMEVDTKDNVSTINDPLIQLVDILSFNCYLGWYGGKPSDCDTRQWKLPKNKPFFVSEFGAGAVAGRFGDKTEKWTEEYQAEVYRHTIAMFDRLPGFVGCSPWILMDFRSPRRQNHDTQNYFNRKGLVTETGQTKQAFYVLQNYYKYKGRDTKKK
ncbi:MAG: beta-glucuronidase [Prevotella sp.]|nr:beta-glucuronidase [Prevotella sp.]